MRYAQDEWTMCVLQCEVLMASGKLLKKLPKRNPYKKELREVVDEIRELKYAPENLKQFFELIDHHKQITKLCFLEEGLK